MLLVSLVWQDVHILIILFGFASDLCDTLQRTVHQSVCIQLEAAHLLACGAADITLLAHNCTTNFLCLMYLAWHMYMHAIMYVLVP